MPCLHKFHKSCINTLVEKHPEVNAECLHEYALPVSMACPLCRTTFKDMQCIKVDHEVTEAFEYSSSDDE